MSDDFTTYDGRVIRKLSAYVPISAELLLEPTDEDRERWRKRAEERAAEYRAALARHDELLATTTGLRHAILGLHAPVPKSYGDEHECRGCELNGYDAEHPDWPCRTYELARDES